MYKISTEEELRFYNEIKKVYSGENFINDRRCKKIVNLIHEYYLENALYDHYLHSLEKNDSYISNISLENIYTLEQIQMLIKRLESYLEMQSLKNGFFISSEAIGFSALAILISLGGSTIVETSKLIAIFIITMLSFVLLNYVRNFWKNNESINRTSNVIALLEHYIKN